MLAWLHHKPHHVPAAQARNAGGTACFGLRQYGAAGTQRPSQYEQLLDEFLLSGSHNTLDHQLWRQGLRCSKIAGMSAAVAPAPLVVHLQAAHMT